MSDRFYTAIEIPVLATEPFAPASGFLKFYGKDGLIYQKDSTGVVTLLTNSSSAGVPYFIQDTQPTYSSGPYKWLQTNVGGDPTKFTEWFYVP